MLLVLQKKVTMNAGICNTGNRAASVSPRPIDQPMRSSFHITRRSFLQRCTVAAAASGLPLWFVQRDLAAAEVTAGTGDTPAPNDRPGIGLIGCGGQGCFDAQNAAGYGDVVAVCDVDQQRADAAVQKFAANGRSPAKYGDFRKLLERDDVRVIVQGVPDHWHTLINIAAAKARKDVYG
jgi:hypothetical protein